MLLMICQVFVPGRRSSHSEGASQIYKHRGRQKPKDSFERLLLATLRGPVVIEALFNKRIALSDDEWAELVGTEVVGPSPTASIVQSLTTVPSLMHKNDLVLSSSQIYLPANVPLECQARYLRAKFLPALETVRQKFFAHEHTVMLTENTTDIVSQLTAYNHVRLYCLGLFIGLVLNYIVCAVTKEPFEIMNQTEHFATEIVSLARYGSRYQPLGTTIFILALETAGGMTRDLSTKSAIRKLVLEFELGLRDDPEA